MRRIDAGDAQPTGGKTSERPTLGAMAVNEIERAHPATLADQPHQIDGIQRMDGSPHWQLDELHVRDSFATLLKRGIAAAWRVDGNDLDTALCKASGQIEKVPSHATS